MRVWQILFEHWASVCHRIAHAVVPCQGALQHAGLAIVAMIPDQFQRNADDRELLAYLLATVVLRLVSAEVGVPHAGRRTVSDGHGSGKQMEFAIFALKHVTVAHAGNRDLIGEAVEERHQLLRGIVAFPVVGSIQQCSAPGDARVQPYGAIRRGRTE